MPKAGVTTAAGRKRKIEEIRATARFGNFPIPADMSPVDILMNELHRSAGFCHWIEIKFRLATDTAPGAPVAIPGPLGCAAAGVEDGSVVRS